MDIAKNTPAWLNKTTGAIDIAELIDGEDGVSALVYDLQHSLHHLVADLEFGLDLKRGKVEDTTVTLNFQRDSIDATIWIAGIAWGRAKDLATVLEAAQQAIDEAAK